MMDASFESGTDFFYDVINAPTQNCAIIFQLSLFYMMSKSQFSLNLTNPLL